MKVAENYEISSIENMPAEYLTSELLIKAQTGEIPAAALGKFDLDVVEVNLFLARELLFLHSAAEGAKMHNLSQLLYELHLNLLKKSKFRTVTS
jgi:hypothetical protein